MSIQHEKCVAGALFFTRDGARWTVPISEKARQELDLVRVVIPTSWRDYVTRRLPDVAGRRQFTIREHCLGIEYPKPEETFDGGWTVEYLYDSTNNPSDIDFWITDTIDNSHHGANEDCMTHVHDTIPAYNLSLDDAMQRAQRLMGVGMQARCRHQKTGEVICAEVLG